MPVRGDPHNLHIGHDLPASAGEDLKQAWERAKYEKYDFISLPLAASGGQGVGAAFQPAAESDLDLGAEIWRTSVVGAVSADLDPDGASAPGSGDTAAAEDAADGLIAAAEVRRASLETELRWAAHLGLRGVLLPPPAAGSRGCGYARAVNELLLEGLFTECDGCEDNNAAPLSLRVPAVGGWPVWNRFRTLCDHHPKLAVALEFGGGGGGDAAGSGGAAGAEGGGPKGRQPGGSEKELQRWLGEPVRYVILHRDAFLTNRSGHPVLPKKLKGLLQGLFQFQVQVIVAVPDEDPAKESSGDESAAAEEPGSAGAAGAIAAAAADAATPAGGAPAGGAAAVAEGAGTAVWCSGGAAGAAAGAAVSHEALLDYVARLYQGLPTPTQAQRFAQSHLDTLQAPLQPLQDNLASETYEVFEADPVKYKQYEEAVLAFLQDRLKAGRSPPFAVMVLGAGRGPLVAASIRAARRADTTVQVWAVEKNPNAVHALRHRRKREADWSCVEVIAEDMRVWKAPRKADAIVSELLGSFGDNELSPECIDGAQHLLAEDGACIPQRYVSSLAPVSSPICWAEARGQPASCPGGGMAGGDAGQLETAYVVSLHRAFYPTSGPKDCFTYRHPKHPLEKSNDRSAELVFEAETDALIHGFVGYFDCTLYGDVCISIDPRTFSEGMFSWFPMFFPLQVPVLLRKGDVLRSHWWRRHDARKVWYEWALSEPAPTSVQNAGGRSWSIGLQ